ncbi:MAG: hypothetical protein RQ826_17225, partial [Xanthomonadales bacterium]|nr:hypothetical protein [Xanthomonadales bacterium]
MRNRKAYAAVALAIVAGLSISIYFSFQDLSLNPTEATNSKIDSKPDSTKQADQAGVSQILNSLDPTEETSTVEAVPHAETSTNGPGGAERGRSDPLIEPQDFETVAEFFQALKDDFELTSQEMARNLVQW